MRADDSLSKTRVQLHVNQDDSLSDEVSWNTITVTRDVHLQKAIFGGTRKW